MSTKIYNAFIFNDIFDFETLQLRIKEFQEDLLPEIQDYFMINKLNKMISYYDTILTEKEYTPVHIGDNCYDLLLNNLKEAIINNQIKQIRDFYNFDFEVMFYIKKYNEKVYCKVFTENNAVLIKLIDFFNLIDYHYQNSTDAPENFTKEEWDERNTIWIDKLLDGNNSFMDANFIKMRLLDFKANLSIFPTQYCFYIYVKENINKLNSIFNIEERAINFSNNYIWEYIIREKQLKPSQYIKLKNIKKENNLFYNKYRELNNFIKEQFMLIAPKISKDNFDYYKLNLNVWSKDDLNQLIYNKVKEINFDNVFELYTKENSF